MKKLVVICGPTGTGKTSLALKLCQKFNGEIVSVDSRQIYKGLTIGSGKDIRDTKYEILNTSDGYWDIGDKSTGAAVRIHLYDLIEPNEELNVVQFAKIAGPIIERIWARGKVPFLVGGAGLYFEVLLGRVAVAKVDPNPELRRRLGKLSNEELFAKLKELDPERARTIDPNSPHRLIRAIEIAESRQSVGGKKKPPQGTPLRSLQNLKGWGVRRFSSDELGNRWPGGSGFVEVLPPDLEPLWIGLNAPREFLYKKIDQRLEGMVEAGLLEEIKTLVERYGWEAPALNSIGYIEFKPYFEKTATLEECLVRAKFNTHAYARRQLTWFRRNKDIQWFDITEDGFEQRVKKAVEEY